MGIKEFLKDIFKLEASLIKVEPKIADEIRNLKIGKMQGNFVYIENFTNIDENSLKRVAELLFVEKRSVVREDVAGEDAIVLENIQNPDTLSGKLRPYLRGEDYGALSYALYVVKLEDKGMEAIEEHNKLFQTYTGRGIRIYSLLRAGIFKDKISVLIDEGVNKDEIRKHIDSLITAPDAIFVDRFMNKENVKEEINKRLSKGKEAFQIFARAGRIDEAIGAVKELTEEEKIIHKIEHYTLGTTRAVTIHIQKLESRNGQD
jgi:hypothetical protein